MLPIHHLQYHSPQRASLQQGNISVVYCGIHANGKLNNSCTCVDLWLFNFSAYFLEEMDSIHGSKYLTFRLKLNKRIETVNGMKLPLGPFSGYYLIVRLAQELVKITLEKHWIVTWFAAKRIWALDNLKHILQLADMLCFPFFRLVKYNFTVLFLRGNCVGCINGVIVNEWLWLNFS